MGSWWAYYELGWGGWWFWDPVENASFMPWLIATALIHSLIATERRGTFKAWTLLLAIASEPTTAERQAASEAAQKYLAENAYILPIFEEPQVFGLTAKVHGFDTESVGRPAFYSTWLAG